MFAAPEAQHDGKDRVPRSLICSSPRHPLSLVFLILIRIVRADCASEEGMRRRRLAIAIRFELSIVIFVE